MNTKFDETNWQTAWDNKDDGLKSPKKHYQMNIKSFEQLMRDHATGADTRFYATGPNPFIKYDPTLPK